MRSKLFVPGGRPDLFAKAYASAADAVSFDLEDAVLEEGKATARADVATFVATRQRNGKRVIVRVNAPGTPHFDADLAAIVGAGPDLINVPKLESAQQVQAVAAALEKSGPGLGAPRLLLNIETPRGLRAAAEIAAAHPRVAGLQLGLGDLFEAQGIRRDDPANVHAAMFAVAMAAAEAGVWACDGAHPDFRDPAAFERDTPRFWRALCEKTGLHALADDPRLDSVRKRALHADEILPQLHRALQAHAALEWERIFGDEVPCAAARQVEDMFDHPQVLAEGMIAEIPHPLLGSYRGVARPIRFGRTPGPEPFAAPTLGQHSGEILAAAAAGEAEDRDA